MCNSINSDVQSNIFSSVPLEIKKDEYGMSHYVEEGKEDSYAVSRFTSQEKQEKGSIVNDLSIIHYFVDCENIDFSIRKAELDRNGEGLVAETKDLTISLSMEQVEKVIESLQYMIRNHVQVLKY
jgi:hypothetical protein